MSSIDIASFLMGSGIGALSVLLWVYFIVLAPSKHRKWKKVTRKSFNGSKWIMLPGVNNERISRTQQSP